MRCLVGCFVNYIRRMLGKCPARVSDYWFVLTNSGLRGGDAEKRPWVKFAQCSGWGVKPMTESKRRETEGAKTAVPLRIQAATAR
jgi:hypothetical protein